MTENWLVELYKNYEKPWVQEALKLFTFLSDDRLSDKE